MHRHVSESELAKLPSTQVQHLEQVSDSLKSTYHSVVSKAEQLPRLPFIGETMRRMYMSYHLGSVAINYTENTSAHDVTGDTSEVADDLGLIFMQQDDSTVATARAISVATANRGIYMVLPTPLKKRIGKKIAGNWLLGYMEAETFSSKGRYS